MGVIDGTRQKHGGIRLRIASGAHPSALACNAVAEDELARLSTINDLNKILGRTIGLDLTGFGDFFRYVVFVLLRGDFCGACQQC